MSAYVRELQDNDGNTIYPVTRARAVFMPGGTDTVERILGDMQDQGATIAFTGNKITKTLASGNSVETVFSDDGNITETTKNENGDVVQIKTTTFNEDGSIEIHIEGENEDEE